MILLRFYSEEMSIIISQEGKLNWLTNIKQQQCTLYSIYILSNKFS